MLASVIRAVALNPVEESRCKQSQLPNRLFFPDSALARTASSPNFQDTRSLCLPLPEGED
jgi:hypothetical protein